MNIYSLHVSLDTYSVTLLNQRPYLWFDSFNQVHQPGVTFHHAIWHHQCFYFPWNQTQTVYMHKPVFSLKSNVAAGLSSPTLLHDLGK